MDYKHVKGTVQSLYNTIFGVHRNGPYYKRSLLQRDNFTNEQLENDLNIMVMLTQHCMRGSREGWGGGGHCTSHKSFRNLRSNC